MTSERDPAAWPVITGTARGSSHETRRLPTQDSVASAVIAGGAGVVAAVADGHGASRHFRSATGSQLAVQAALAVAAELTAEADSPWNADVAAWLRDELPQAMVERWRQLVDQDLAAHPYAPAEKSELAGRGDGPDIPYGSTLIVALIVAQWLVCAQIGDGDLVAIRPDGEAWAPVSGDSHLDGYHTTSLCQASAVGSFRVGAYDLRAEPLLALLLSTDGYGNAQVSDPWQPALARDLAELAARHGRRWFEHQVPVWAERCASADGSGDDTTIALLLAPDSQRLAAALAPAAGGSQERSPWAPQSPAARRRAAEAAGAPPYRSSAFPPQPHRPPPGPAAPRRPWSRPPWSRPPWTRLSRRRAVIAGSAAVVAAAALTAGLLASQSPGAPAAHPTGKPAPRASLSASARPGRASASAPVRSSASPATAPVKRASSPAGSAQHQAG